MPKVSLCIPSYKPEHFELALTSALAQTFRDTEILVSDDCRSDAIRDIAARYPGVQYSRNPVPGATANTGRLIELARGEYIKFVFDDDMLHPFCVQYLLEALEATRAQGTTLAFSPRDHIDADNRVLTHDNPFNVTQAPAVLTGPAFIALTATTHRNLVGEYTTTMFRKADCFDPDGRINLFDLDGERCAGLTDLSAWVRLASRGNLVACPETLSYFRRHDNSNSNPALNKDFIFAVTDYEVIMRYAIRHGHIAGRHRDQAVQNLIHVYRNWAGTFPELMGRAQSLNETMARSDSLALLGADAVQ